MKEGLNILPFLKTSRYLDKCRFIFRSSWSPFYSQGRAGTKKVVVTFFNWKCKCDFKTLSKQMTCGALKQFNGELLCLLTAVLLLHKESPIWSLGFHSSVMGEGKNCCCSSIILNFKGIIVLNVKFKIKNPDILPDDRQKLKFPVSWSLWGTSLMQVVGKAKPSFCGFFSCCS